RTVNERIRNEITDAELRGFDRRRILRSGALASAPRHKTMDRLDLGETRAHLATELERSLDRRMGEPATGIGLEAMASLHEVVAGTQILERLDRHRQVAANRIEIAVTALDRGRVRGEATLAQKRRHHAVAGSVATMQRLRHGAEIGVEAARQRSRN